MAETADLAPTRRRSSATGSRTRSRASTASKRTPEELEAQVERLQSDLKAITQTLARLSTEKVAEVRTAANGQVQHLVDQGKGYVDEAADQVSAYEKQLKTVVRERPLTALGAAIGVGFILALLARG